MVGVAVGVVTLSVAACVFAVPQVLVKTARNWWPLSAARRVMTSVRPVAPPTSAKVAPPSALTCHCTLGAGMQVKTTPTSANASSQWGYRPEAGACSRRRLVTCPFERRYDSHIWRPFSDCSERFGRIRGKPTLLSRLTR
jgi:hypothetical protein